MLPPMSVVSPRLPGRNLKPGGGMNKWMKLYERSVHGSNPIVPWGREVWRPRGQKLPTLTPSMWQIMPSGWQSLKQRKKYLPQYSQMVVVFSILPNRWTAQTRTSSACANSRTLDAPDDFHMLHKSMWMRNAKWNLHFSFKRCILRPKHTS